MPQIYVSSPTTVTVDWSTTGDKTLLTITDNLPAGNKIVLFALGWDAATTVAAQGYLKIMTGSTVLVQEGITHYLNTGGDRPKHVMLFAYHTNAPANAQYTFIATVTTAASGSSTMHVQGMVILLTEPAFFATGINTNIAAGATVTLATINTTFPAGSKVAVLAYVQMGIVVYTGLYEIYTAGNIRILKGSTIVSQNQFSVGVLQIIDPACVSLAYLDTNSGANQSYSIQVYNSLSVTSQAWGEIIAFKVSDGAFLDTDSVALTSGSQVTVGNLATSLSGEVGVIALAAAENTSSSTVTAFNAGDVVLQLNNQTTGQISNQRGWLFEPTSYHGRSGIYALFRADTNVSNPSYQVKMTARASGINGEAKILAFTLAVIVTVSDSGAGIESINITASVAISDSGAGQEVIGGARSIADFGTEVESVDMAKGIIDAGSAVEYIISGLQHITDEYGYGFEYLEIKRGIIDAGMATDLVNMKKELFDAGYGIDTIFSPVFNMVIDYYTYTEIVKIALPLIEHGYGAEIINMVKEFIDSFSALETVNMLKDVIEQILVTEIVSMEKQIFDTSIGTDIVGIVANIYAVDYGKGEDFTDSFLSIYGYVTIDGAERIGRHSIPYKDLKRDGLPIQVIRRSANDMVLVDNDYIGSVTVEWEDKVSDISSGYRFIRVVGTVRIVD